MRGTLSSEEEMDKKYWIEREGYRKEIAELQEKLKQIDLALCRVEDQADLQDPEIIQFYIDVCKTIREEFLTWHGEPERMSNIEYMKSRGIVNEVDDWALENAIECCHAARGGEDIARYAAVLRKGVNQGRKEAVSNLKERLKAAIKKQRGTTYWLGESKEKALDLVLELLDTTE